MNETSKQDSLETHSFMEAQNLSAIKKKLDSVSTSMCLAKWAQVSLHLTTGKTHSCYHPPAHDISREAISKNPLALHNTDKKKEERAQMLQGKRPEGCSYCWNTEKNPTTYSDRHFRSLEPWALSEWDNILSHGAEGDITPTYVEVNFNQACQFKCSYCSPHLSSTWMEEAQAFGPYLTANPHNSVDGLKESGLWPIPMKDHNPYVEAFWKWWPDLYPKLKFFRMTGGEPLVDHNTFRVLDYINDVPNRSIRLAITTNLCPPKKQMEKFVKKSSDILKKHHIHMMSVFASIDCWGKQAEYIRHGLKIESFEQNLKDMMRRMPKVLLHFIITTNALSIFTLRPLLEKILEWQQEFNYFNYYEYGKNILSSLLSPKRDFPLHPSGYRRIFLDVPYLRFPEWQALDVLPEGLAHSYLKECLAFVKENPVDERRGKMHGFATLEALKIQRLLDIVEIPVDKEKQKRNRADFYRFFKEHDRRRGTDFLETFPQLREFWFECKNLAQ